MDTSMVQDFLLGNLRIPEDQVPAGVFAQMLRKAIDSTKSKFKHIRYFRVMGECLNDGPNSSSNGINRITDLSKVTFPEDLPKFANKFLLLGRMQDPMFSPEREQAPPYNVRALYVTDDGELFKFSAVYVMLPPEQQRMSHTKMIFCTAGEFSRVDEKELINLIIAYPRLVYEAVKNLLSALDSAISTQRSWVEGLELSRTDILDTFQRVDFK
jgi:hypothetical protein